MLRRRKYSSIRRQSLPGIALWIILAGFLVTMFSYHHWTRSKPNERGVIKWDVISYYGYLPATFIYNDVKLSFIADPEFKNDSKFYYYRLENGNRLIQTTMGLSILYAPFFFAAHALAPVFGQSQDGFSSIYQFFLAFSSLVYVMVGLVLLTKILLKYFSPVATAMTLLLVALGTNLFHYTVHEGPMSHSYNFTLIVLFLYLIIRWNERPDWKYSIWIGLVYGMIVLVRPSNIIAGVLLLLWDVKQFKDLRNRFGFLVRKMHLIGLMVLFFLIPWIPQFIYWKAVTGSYIFNSYGPAGSNFYFGAPHILEVLFSYRKGWYLYTPVMLLATVGLLFLGRYVKQAVAGISLYLLLQIYLLASWWSWWNGGSFGLRSFVDIYGIMALPLAAFIARMWDIRKTWNAVLGVLFGFLIYLNQFQTYQYSKGIIHYTGMTKEAYWLNFLKFNPSGSYWHMLSIPDSQLARKGIYYNYYTGTDNAFLKEMETREGLKYIRKEIESDPKLVRQIRRHAERSGQEYHEVLQMVVERVYTYRTGH